MILFQMTEKLMRNLIEISKNSTLPTNVALYGVYNPTIRTTFKQSLFYDVSK